MQNLGRNAYFAVVAFLLLASGANIPLPIPVIISLSVAAQETCTKGDKGFPPLASICVALPCRKIITNDNDSGSEAHIGETTVWHDLEDRLPRWSACDARPPRIVPLVAVWPYILVPAAPLAKEECIPLGCSCRQS